MDASSTSTVCAMPRGLPPPDLRGALDGGGHLHQAAGVRGHQHLGAGGEDVGGLAVPELARGLGVEDVVDPGRAAAQLGLGDLPQLEAGDRAEQPPRLGAHALGVREVAGVVVGHGHLERVADRDRPELVEDLGDVAHLVGEGPGPVGVRRVVGQQPGVVLHRRPAAGGVDHDPLDPRCFEGVHDPPGVALRLGLTTVVHRQGAAAALSAGDDHFAALGLEHPSRGRVDAGEERPLHAAGEHADDRAPLPRCRDPLGQWLWLAQPRREALHRRQVRRHPLQQAGPAHRPVQPGALHGAQRPAQQSEPAWVREDREDQRAQGAIRGRPVVAPFDLGAGLLDEGVVLHPGRAGGHARHAAQAGVPVRHHRVAHRLPVQALLHQVDPAARGVHLLAPQHVGRAGRQAEAAVHAVADQRGVRWMVLVEGPSGGRQPEVHDAAGLPGRGPVGALVHLRCLPRIGPARAGGRDRTGP